jgi:hypothetical protein
LLIGILLVIFFNVPDGSLYYFTNVAMFISLPFFIFYFDKYIMNMNLQKYIVFMIFILMITNIVASANVYYKQSLLYLNKKASSIKLSILAEDLYLIKQKFSKNKQKIILDASLIQYKQNDLHYSCNNLPFVYVAISELAWINLLDLKKCNKYKHYGYNSYIKNDKILCNIPSGYIVKSIK